MYYTWHKIYIYLFNFKKCAIKNVIILNSFPNLFLKKINFTDHAKPV